MTRRAPTLGLGTDEPSGPLPVLRPHLAAPPRFSHGDDPIRLSSDAPAWGSSRKNPRLARYALTPFVLLLGLVAIALAIAT